ncbi:hypothetical protein R3I93_002412 [Phoxinus phoxinus]|uniref:VWA7 N-terminal domain-containing protein n=1 Tax=Phoxinus phoxinus TaxID=58324 RepID=A0AAN9DKK5_9TELE
MRIAFLLLALLIGVHTFAILKEDNSKNHQEITRMAILRATANVCKSVGGFKETDILNVKTLAKACKKEEFTKNFETGIQMISYYNVITDLEHPGSAKHHFDNEEFVDGKALITNGKQNVINSIKSNKFDDARKALGEILHTLQDFYSHSNWIEMGNTKPCTALINVEENIPNPAGKDTVTCEECSDTKCGAGILKDIIDKKILTSGYFGRTKPKGKCSHGGTLDFTTGIGKSFDGINKDYSKSSHGGQHNDAAKVAIDASVQLLENILKSIPEGGKNFLRYREAT